jgi:hypothetical protein
LSEFVVDDAVDGVVDVVVDDVVDDVGALSVASLNGCVSVVPPVLLASVLLASTLSASTSVVVPAWKVVNKMPQGTNKFEFKFETNKTKDVYKKTTVH